MSYINTTHFQPTQKNVSKQEVSFKDILIYMYQQHNITVNLFVASPSY